MWLKFYSSCTGIVQRLWDICSHKIFLEQSCSINMHQIQSRFDMELGTHFCVVPLSYNIRLCIHASDQRNGLVMSCLVVIKTLLGGGGLQLCSWFLWHCIFVTLYISSVVTQIYIANRNKLCIRFTCCTELFFLIQCVLPDGKMWGPEMLLVMLMTNCETCCYMHTAQMRYGIIKTVDWGSMSEYKLVNCHADTWMVKLKLTSIVIPIFSAIILASMAFKTQGVLNANIITYYMNIYQAPIWRWALHASQWQL